MAKRKIRTVKEQREERLRKLRDEEHVKLLRDRLVLVNTPGKLWAALERQRLFVCGYCAQRMALFSPMAITPSEKNPILYYGCIRRCGPSGIQRANFVDKKILVFLYERLHEKFPKAKGNSAEMDKLMEMFIQIEKMNEERGFLLEALPHAGYDRDKRLEELIKIENDIDTMRAEISGLNNKKPYKSPLLAPIFVIESPEELMDLNLLYKRELINCLVRRMRFFNETLVVVVTPLDEEERRIEEKSGGKIQNIHFSTDIRAYKELETIVGEEEKTEQRQPVEKIDLDFIMNPPNETEAEIISAEPVDVDLLKTEPGSEDERKVRKKQKKDDDS
ncbi:hypothetical protein DRQ36_07660 [bacterium]|nr:MAG: hypothetical protein DRQ36_07660 [bacterium]